MTILSALTDMVLTTSLDGDSKKNKLAIVAAALVGVFLLLRWRGGDAEESEDVDEVESESDEDEESDLEVESEEIKESAKEELVEARHELDAFDMLSILAAAIKAARDEYDQRTGA